MRDIFSGPLIEQILEQLASRPFDQMQFEDNRWFGRNDSAVYYSMIQLYSRRHVFEVGSGNSTKIARQAFDGELVCIDPSPREDVEELADDWVRVRVETLTLDVFDDCDLLFVDSSHIWEAGDLPFLYERVFPTLKPGTLIHSHDIFLPDAYPPAWDPRRYNEQYHLQKFLEENPEYKTIWPAYYMATRRTQEVVDLFGDAKSMGSFWMMKTC